MVESSVLRKTSQENEWLYRMGMTLGYLLVCYSPQWIQYVVGILLGRIMRVHIRRKGIARTNIRLCFPHYTPDQVAQLEDRNARSQGMATIDWLLAWYGNERTIHKQRPHRIIGLDHLKKNDGRGVLLLIKHSQHVMLDARVLSMYHALCAITRDIKHSETLNRCYQKARQQTFKGGNASPHDVIKLLRWLKRGEVVLYAVDHDFGMQRSVVTNFFSEPAATVKAPYKIKKATNGFAYSTVTMKIESLC